MLANRHSPRVDQNAQSPNQQSAPPSSERGGLGGKRLFQARLDDLIVLQVSDGLVKPYLDGARLVDLLLQPLPALLVPLGGLQLGAQLLDQIALLFDRLLVD